MNANFQVPAAVWLLFVRIGWFWVGCGFIQGSRWIVLLALVPTFVAEWWYRSQRFRDDVDLAKYAMTYKKDKDREKFYADLRQEVQEQLQSLTARLESGEFNDMVTALNLDACPCCGGAVAKPGDGDGAEGEPHPPDVEPVRPNDTAAVEHPVLRQVEGRDQISEPDQGPG